MNKPTDIKTKTNFSTLISLILVGIGLCFLSYYWTSTSLESQYPQIKDLFFGLFPGAIGLGSIYSIWQLKKYVFDGEKLIVKSIFNTQKKVIYVRDIKSYNEIEYGKNNNYIVLTIFTDKQRIKISSSETSNYYQLKAALTKGLERDEYSERMLFYKVKRRWGIGIIILGLFICFVTLGLYLKKDLEITSEQLTTIKATIAETPEIERVENSRWINLRLLEYPKFTFEIIGKRFLASYSNAIVSEIKTNDQIELDILKDTYDKKISQTKDLSFIDKAVNYNLISVNGLRKDGDIYLKFQDINKMHKENSSGIEFWILFLLFGIGSTLTGIYFLTLKKPTANNG